MKHISVFFNNNMVVNIPLPSPSPRKPLEVVNQWQGKYPILINDFSSIKVEDIYLAHDREHVDAILSLQKANGMDTKDKELVDSLFWTIGSMYSAAKFSLKNKIAVSPTSGFHHAGFDTAWGFCTFNGLLITALKLLNEKKVKKVGILDFDQHQGDGSENIITQLALDSSIVHITGKTDYTREKEPFFSQLNNGLLEKFKKCDIVLYQAGADQHIEDPLGGFLNNAELRKRDRFVFDFMKKNKISIAWNLAGGYQEEILPNGQTSIQKVLDIHNATMEECVKVYINE